MSDPFGRQLNFRYDAQVRIAAVADHLGQARSIWRDEPGMAMLMWSLEAADPFGNRARNVEIVANRMTFRFG